jgi:SAM-dependent methyltransferase
VKEGPAAGHWRRELNAWAIPQDLLDAAPQSPYGWPASLWRRRAAAALASDRQTPTLDVIARLAGPGGSVLDIGAGTGRASLPLAQAGHPVTALEPSKTMLEGLADTSLGLPVAVIEGRWPEAKESVETHRVAMCAHVVFDVAEVGPFLTAMNERAAAGVVIEMTDRHPWVHLGPYYRALHALERPLGPSWEDLVKVVHEVVGVEPTVEHWRRPTDLWFESVEEILEFYGKRLLIGPDRWTELRALLEPDLVSGPDGHQVGTESRDLVTIWWPRHLAAGVNQSW